MPLCPFAPLPLCFAFDAVGTLIFPHPPVAEVYFEAGARFGSGRTLEEVAARFRSAFRQVYGAGMRSNSDQVTLASSEKPNDSSQGEALERRRWREIVGLVFDDVPRVEDCFEVLFDHFALASSWRCYPDVAETLKELGECGFPLLVASNFDRRLRTICKEHPDLAWLRTAVISSEVGFHKPQAGFYRALVNAAGCAPRELVMIGDDWENDIVGALSFGLKAIYLDREGAAPPPGAATDTPPGVPSVPIIRSLVELRNLLP